MVNKRQIAKRMTVAQLRNYLATPVYTANLGTPAEVRKMKAIVREELEKRSLRDEQIILAKMPTIFIPERLSLSSTEVSGIFGIDYVS